MGATASVAAELELAKPVDASDLSRADPADLLAEVVRLRALIRSEYTDAAALAPLPFPSPLPVFKLERYFAEYEFTAPHLICCSDCEPLSMAEVLAMADPECAELWAQLSLGYTESQGLPLLRNEISRLYAPGTIGPNDSIVLAPEEGIYLAMHACLSPGDRVLVTGPCYQSLSQVAASLGCSVEEWRCRERKRPWRLPGDACGPGDADDAGDAGDADGAGDAGPELAFHLEDLEAALEATPCPKMVVVNFPHSKLH